MLNALYTGLLLSPPAIARYVAFIVLVTTGFAPHMAVAEAPDGGTSGAKTELRSQGAPDAGIAADGGSVRHAAAAPHTGSSKATTAHAATPPPKPVSDEEKALALMRKKQFDQACPLLEKTAKAAPDVALTWEELGQCEWDRKHRKAAVEAAAHAAEIGDRSTRKAAYQTLMAAGGKVSLPVKGCEWLPESPGGVCGEQMWACGYDWDTPGSSASTGGHAVTFGLSDDEREILDGALRDNTALRPALAAEWKALMDSRQDELACDYCNQHAVDSANGLVDARAAACFQLKTGRVQPPEVCVQADADCDVRTACLDEASTLARRTDSEKNRSLWPEAFDVIAATHKVCEATCGVVGTTRCDVVSVDACRGFVGYACIQSLRGQRPAIRFGEISVNDRAGNWSEAPTTDVPGKP